MQDTPAFSSVASLPAFALHVYGGQVHSESRVGRVTASLRKQKSGPGGLRSETEHLESIYQQKLDPLTELKQPILHKAFTGELTADSNAVNCTLMEASL